MSELSARLERLTPEQQLRLRSRLRARENPYAVRGRERPAGMPRLSLYFFANAAADAGARSAADYYAFLLECARRADRSGFHAVWLPERHFVEFGGFSPNPVVLAAALATTTRRIGIRAGSVAAPLHHPVRIAEDWAVVDNLSGGRTGISFATGWHPDDFVLSRTDYADRRAQTLRTVEEVRALWRGRSADYPSAAGGTATVGIRPVPVQRELPVWLTTAGNPESFEAAGAAGYGVMTALLGQTLPRLRDNICRYRAAWRTAGHPADGDVVVMAHTYVSERPDLEDALRAPMRTYLSAYREQRPAPEADTATLLEEAYQSYLAGPSLLGTPDKARGVLAVLAEAGADEVGCLLDFGLPPGEVLGALPALAALVPPATDSRASEGTAR